MTRALSLDLLRGSWSAIPDGVGPIAALDLPVPGLSIAVSAGTRRLLALTTQSIRPPDVSGAALTDQVRDLAFDGKGGRFLDVACADPGLFDVFDDLIVDITTVAEGLTPGDTIQPALDRWRSLFQVLARRGMTRAAQIGLFGELSVLERLTSAYGADVLDLWRGPDNAAHDFELFEGCLEVKTSGETSEFVTIHGLGQLDEHDDRPLHLLVETAREGAKGKTIRDVVRAIEDVTGSDTLGPLLASLGFDAAVPDTRFEVVESFVVMVDGRVPKLVKSTATHPEAIARVEYGVKIELLQSLRSNLDSGAAIGILMGGAR